MHIWSTARFQKDLETAKPTELKYFPTIPFSSHSPVWNPKTGNGVGFQPSNLTGVREVKWLI